MSDQKEKQKASTRWTYKLLSNIAISSVAAVLSHYGGGAFINVIWPRVTSFWQIWWLTLVGTTVVFLIGLILFAFKKYYQKVYGLSEIGFALAVGWTSIMRAQSTADAASLLAILAAAYLMVRGLSNYDEASKPKAV